MDLLFPKHKIKKKLWDRMSDFFYLPVRKRIFFWISFWTLIFFIIFLVFVYPEILKPSFIYEKNIDIEPNGEVIIRFDQPILKSSVKNFSIEPKTKGNFYWKDEVMPGFAKTFIFVPTESFNLGSLYFVKFSKIISLFGTSLEDLVFPFISARVPKVKEIIPADKSDKVEINMPIKIIFDRPNYYFDFKFELEPETKFNVEVNNKKTEYTLKPLGLLEQGKDYKLKLTQIYGFGKEVIGSYEFSFKTIEPLTVMKIIPENNSFNRDIIQSIEIVFDRRVDYESVEDHFSIEPNVDGEFIWEDEKLTFAPIEPLKTDTEYEIKLRQGIWAYQHTSYSTEDIITKFKTRSEFSQKVLSNIEVPPQITEGKYIDIDITSQTLTLFENGNRISAFKISTGKYSMPTPLGRFSILNKTRRAYSSTYKLYMPYWMAFTRLGHGIHELPEWPGGMKEGQSHLGIRVSHGCVRLGVGPAEMVYNWAPIGTPVLVH